MTTFAYFCGHEQFQPEELVRHAVLAEEAGFDMVEVSEHFHPWVDDLGASGFAFATIAAMAQATERIQFVTGVTTPLFRFHPAVVAQAAATLDRLSGGRFNLGVGTGENLNEGPLGYTFPKYAERAARMSEALDIMNALLSGEKLTFDGEFYTTDRAKLYSPPLHPVPISHGCRRPEVCNSGRHQSRRSDHVGPRTRNHVRTGHHTRAGGCRGCWQAIANDPRIAVVDPCRRRRSGMDHLGRMAGSARTWTPRSR